MRQRRWLELIKDYDLTINYTQGKANVVADALSRKSTDNILVEQDLPEGLLKDLERLAIQMIRVDTPRSLHATKIMEERQCHLREEIINRQEEDPFIRDEIQKLVEGKPSRFRLGESYSLWFGKRICVPDVPEIKAVILQEAHETPYSIHPGSTKMYMDLKEVFWWNNVASYLLRKVEYLCNLLFPGSLIAYT